VSQKMRDMKFQKYLYDEFNKKWLSRYHLNNTVTKTFDCFTQCSIIVPQHMLVYIKIILQ
jgi:hypothetical protein